MNFIKQHARKFALAILAAVGAAALASCGGGGSSSGGGGASGSTMTIQPRSLVTAQIMQLPAQRSFNAMLTHDAEDQHLVYGFSLSEGEYFGAQITANNGQIMQRFYDQNGVEIPPLQLPNNAGQGFRAETTGNYFIAVSAAPDAGAAASGIASDGLAPQAVFPIAIPILIRWGVISAAEAALASAALRALAASIVTAVSAREAARRLRQLERPDLEVASSVSCPGGNSSVPPGASCTLTVTVRNIGGRLEGAVVGLFSHAPGVTYYRSGDNEISGSGDDRNMGMETLSSIARLLATASVPAVLRSRFTVPTVPGTYYYGACVDPTFLEKGTGLSAGPFNDLTANNCSDGAQVVVVGGLYLAIATPSNRRVVGMALDFSSQSAADDFALSYCRGANEGTCRVVHRAEPYQGRRCGVIYPTDPTGTFGGYRVYSNNPPFAWAIDTTRQGLMNREAVRRCVRNPYCGESFVNLNSCN